MRTAIMTFLLVGCVTSTTPELPASTGETNPGRQDPAGYWDQLRSGANMFSMFPSARRFRDARAVGIRMIRLMPDRWQGLERDFLIGDADRYEGLVQGDLQRLRSVLAAAHASGLQVVLGMLSLPGARWRQHNGDVNDVRLWVQPGYAQQAAQFLGDLARELADDPSIVGYNPVNEPRTDDNARLRQIYAEIIAAIRKNDPNVPIVLDVGRDASPSAFANFEAFDDPAILYAFHLYEPWEHTTWRIKPGKVSYGSEPWSRSDLAAAIGQVDRWRKQQGVPANRVFASEIGCDRRVPGVEGYFQDALSLVEARCYHWAFFSFREDDWAGFDYEFGARPLTEAERETFARGRALDVPRPGGPAFDVIKAHLNHYSGCVEPTRQREKDANGPQW